MSAAERTSREEVLGWLRDVKDPELPAADVVGLGIVRDVEVDEAGVTVVITPTFSGCPAMQAIEDDVAAALERRGLGRVRVRRELSPPWSTEDIEATTRQRLRESGIAPPPCVRRAEAAARCPRCGAESELRSRFGSTPCKALWVCPACLEPFEGLKAI